VLGNPDGVCANVIRRQEREAEEHKDCISQKMFAAAAAEENNGAFAERRAFERSRLSILFSARQLSLKIRENAFFLFAKYGPDTCAAVSVPAVGGRRRSPTNAIIMQF
jgi:hypothetical protein